MERIKFVLFRPKAPPPGWKCPKRFKLGLGPPWESSDSKEDSEIEMDELLLMASQRYEEQDKAWNGIVDKRNDLLQDEPRKYDEVENLKTPAHGCVEDVQRSRVVTTGDGKQESNVSRYGSPQSSLQVQAVRKRRVPVKTRE